MTHLPRSRSSGSALLKCRDQNFSTICLTSGFIRPANCFLTALSSREPPVMVSMRRVHSEHPVAPGLTMSEETDDLAASVNGNRKRRPSSDSPASSVPEAQATISSAATTASSRI